MEKKKYDYGSAAYHQYDLRHEIKEYGRGQEIDRFGNKKWREKWYECSCGKKFYEFDKI
jgi:hypothetical protein